MELAEHEKKCIETLGKPFTEVHKYLDSYMQKYRGHAHRRILHHELGAQICQQKFGGDSGKAARLHIHQDLGYVPKSWKELENNYFPLGNEDERQREDLIELYGQKKYDQTENNP